METATLPTLLFRLQELDTAIEQLQARVADVRRRERANPQLEKMERELERAREREKAAASRQRSLEAELADLEVKIKRDHGRLYGGTMIDPRELGLVEREMGHLQEKKSELEDSLLLAMEENEAAHERVEQLSREANAGRERWEDERPTLEQEEEDLTDELAGLRDEREKLVGQVEPGALSMYQRTAKAHGHGVSRVRDGICEWCRVVIPPKDVQHARGGDLVYCTNCSRILYVG